MLLKKYSVLSSFPLNASLTNLGGSLQQDCKGVLYSLAPMVSVLLVQQSVRSTNTNVVMSRISRRRRIRMSRCSSSLRFRGWRGSGRNPNPLACSKACYVNI